MGQSGGYWGERHPPTPDCATVKFFCKTTFIIIYNKSKLRESRQHPPAPGTDNMVEIFQCIMKAGLRTMAHNGHLLYNGNRTPVHSKSPRTFLFRIVLRLHIRVLVDYCTPVAPSLLVIRQPRQKVTAIRY